MAVRRIAVEEAFVTADIMAQWQLVLASRNVEPGFAKMGETILARTAANKPLDDHLLDIGMGRIAHMDTIGIDMQILSLTSPGVQVFDAPLATRLAAESNDALAAAVNAHPNRFAGLAAIAPQLPAVAAREIERGQQLGLCGVIINSHTMGEYLDAPQFRPIFEAAEALDMPIYLHPREPAPSMVAPYLDYGLYFAGWGFAAETGLHAMRLIMSGTFTLKATLTGWQPTAGLNSSISALLATGARSQSNQKLYMVPQRIALAFTFCAYDCVLVQRCSYPLATEFQSAPL